MLREDKILKSFLSDSIITDKYEIDPEMYQTIDEALASPEPIVKAIAMIIRGMDHSSSMNEKTLYQQVVNYLNKATL